MKKYLKQNGIKVLALVLIAALIFGVGAHLRGGRAGALNNAVGQLRSPLQKAVTSAVSWLEGIYGYVYEYDQLVAENQSLKAQLAEAQARARNAAEALAENERLKELLNLQQKHEDFVFESAKIVAFGASNWSSTMSLSKGSTSGIELGDPVVTEYGALVGQIAELGDNWATVRTVIDVDSSIGALVGDSYNAGMVVGEFTLMRQGFAKMTYLTESAAILTGDDILSSGKGGVIPPGLLLGTVTEVRTEAGGQTVYGIVKPVTDLGSLSQVFIIKEFDVTE